MKKLLIAGLGVALAAEFSICLNQSTSSGGNSGDGRMALVAKTNSAEYWVKVKEGAEAAGKKLGVDVSFNGPGTGSKGDKQLSQLQGAINGRPLGIGFASQDDAQDGAPAPMDRVKGSGVPVVILDIPPNGSDVPVATVASDDRGMGIQAAEKLAALTSGKDKVAIIAHGEAGTAVVRRDGFKEYLAKNAPELQIIDVQNGESGPAESRNKAQDILQAHPDLADSSGTDDGSTIATADEMAAENLQTKVVGVGSSLDVVSLLEQSRISGIVVQNPYGMDKKTVELVVVMLRGESPAGKNAVSESVWVTTENPKDPDIQRIVN